MSKWRPSLGPALLNISVVGMNSGIEGTHRKSANDIKLCGVADMVKGRDATWTGWRYGTMQTLCMSTRPSTTVHTCHSNPKHKHRLSGQWIEKRPGEKNLWVQVDKKLNMSQPQAPAHRNSPCAGLRPQRGQQGRWGFCPSAPLR